MKKYLIAIAMVLTLSLNADAAAQKHRHTPRTEQVDSTKTKDAIEAFSDTTAVENPDSNVIDATINGQHVTITSDEDVKGVLQEVFGQIDSEMVFGMLTALGILFILFVLFPIIIIIGVVYFINRNRKERYKLAQMAVQNGQPIPDQLLKEEAVQNSNDYQKGIRQMFTGIGLAVFLGIVAGEIGFGIGALVFFIGLGKWYIARQAGVTENNSQYSNKSDKFENPSNIQNYDKETNAL